MTPAKRPEPGLMERLPAVSGSLQADAPMARFSWFKTGGMADVLFQPADADDLAGFLKNKPADVPATVIGTASNIIFRDGGVEAEHAVLEERHVLGAAGKAENIARLARFDGLGSVYGRDDRARSASRRDAGPR